MTLIDSFTDFSCKRFARHVAMEVEPLEGGFYRKLQFWIHWVICPFCKRYWKEVKAIGEIQRKDSSILHHPAAKMAEIQQRLKEKLLKRPPL